jgi:hypothetical protein
MYCQAGGLGVFPQPSLTLKEHINLTVDSLIEH